MPSRRKRGASALWARLAVLSLLVPAAAGWLPAQAAAAARGPSQHAASSRDPFKTLIAPPGTQGRAQLPNRPPGQAGLVIHELQVQGVAIGGPTGPVALVLGTDKETYFLRPGDRIFDGIVVRIVPGGIVFQRTQAINKGETVGAEELRSIVDESSGMAARGTN